MFCTMVTKERFTVKITSASPNIVSSPRPVKGRTSSPKLKEHMSAQSSMTSQTMSCRTESTYSVSQSSPGSQEGRPKVVLHVLNMENGRSSESCTIEENDIQSNHGSIQRRKQKAKVSKKNKKKMNANRRSSLNSGASSQGSSRSDLMGDASLERKDSMISYPHRWPTAEEQEESNDHSDDDKLSPLIDPVSARLQKLDEKAKVVATCHQSVGTNSFSASYGSISLGGDASLSSSDTFRNSPVGGKPAICPADTVPHKPNLQAQPQKKILKPNPNPNPISWSRRRYQSDESRNSQSEAASSSSCLSASSESISRWEESLQSGDRSLMPHRKGCISVSSGDCSIATYSEQSNSHSGDVSRSNQRRGDSSQNRSDRSSTTIGSSIVQNSWSLGKSDAMFSVTTEGKRKKDDVSTVAARSYSSWTSSDEWTAPKDIQHHWASKESKFTDGSLSEWTSGDNSSSEEEEGKNESGVVRKKHEKPRSAFDKDAPWYCGEENSSNDSMNDLDSLNSDTSSVLSNLRRKNPKKKQGAKKLAGRSDASMSFTNLVKPTSMSLSDLGDAAEGKEERRQPQDDSISLCGLLEVQSDAFPNEESLFQTMDEVPVSQELESTTLSVDLGENSSRLRSSVFPVHDDETLDDLESSGRNKHQLAEDSQGDMQSRVHFRELLKIFELKWVRRLIYTGLVFFLIFDIALVALLLTR